MQSPEELHYKAMDLSDEAFMLNQKGFDGAEALLLEAAHLEAEAAQSFPPEIKSEPSRSVLFRSAATLAYEAEAYELAERLVGDGLRGYAPAEIRAELRDLSREISLIETMQNQEREITENGFTIILDGRSTYHGGAEVGQLIKRLEKAKSMFYRTLYRLYGLPYDAERKDTGALQKLYELYATESFAGSYGINVQVVHPGKQTSWLEGVNAYPVDPDVVIKEVSDCLSIWNSGNPSELKEAIEDELYYDNFVGLAKQFAPDGDHIMTVGFNSHVASDSKPIIVRRTTDHWRKAELAEVSSSEDENKVKSRMLTGILTHASTPPKGKWGTVKINDESEGLVIIKVKRGYMKDTVQPYYEEVVTVKVSTKDGKNYLDSIELATPTNEI